MSTCSGRCSKELKYCEKGPPYSSTDAISSASNGTGFSGLFSGGNFDSSNHAVAPASCFLTLFAFTPSFARARITSWKNQFASHSRGSLNRTMSATSSSGNSRAISNRRLNAAIVTFASSRARCVAGNRMPNCFPSDARLYRLAVGINTDANS